MAVAATGRLSAPLRMLGNLVAASATFQGLTGSADAAAARLRVYDVARFDADIVRPCAYVSQVEGESGSESMSTTWYRDTVGLEVSFEFPIAIVVTVTRTGAVATATYTAHGLAVGDVVHVYGADQSAYNGHQTITAVTANTFSWAVSGSPATPATGTIRAIADTPQFANEEYRFTNALGAIESEILALAGTSADPEFTTLTYFAIKSLKRTKGPGRCLEDEANVREAYYGATYRVIRGL